MYPGTFFHLSNWETYFKTVSKVLHPNNCRFALRIGFSHLKLLQLQARAGLSQSLWDGAIVSAVVTLQIGLSNLTSESPQPPTNLPNGTRDRWPRPAGTSSAPPRCERRGIIARRARGHFSVREGASFKFRAVNISLDYG